MDIAYGHDGAVWFAEENGQRIGRYAMDGSLTEYPTPGIYPAYVRPGPDNDMWFNDGSHMIGRVTSSGAVQIYSLGLHYVVDSMNTGPDKRMWFDADLCFQTCKYYIAEFLSSTGSYRILNTSCAPQFIGLGADGNLWAMGPDSSHMETVSASGCQEQVQLPGNQFCCDYGTQIVNAHGNIWLSVIDNPPVPTVLDYFDTRSRSFTIYPITIQVTRGPCSAFAERYRQIAEGPDGVVYVTNCTTHIVRLDTLTGTQLPDLIVQRGPDGMIHGAQDEVIGPDGNLWFTQSDFYQPQNANALDVYLIRRMSVSPSTIDFQSVGQSQVATVSETNYNGAWTGASSDLEVASVSQGTGGAFQVTAVGPGSATITFADSVGNSFPVSVTVP